MNARLPELAQKLAESELPIRFEWESRFGLMVIDVVDGVAYVNGEPVEPAPGCSKQLDRSSRSPS